MNRYVPVAAVLAAVVFAASFACFLSDGSDAADETVTIKGTVTDSSSEALTGVTVKIISGTTIHAATIDGTTYTVTNIPATEDLDALTIMFLCENMAVSSAPTDYYKDNENGRYTLLLDTATQSTSGNVTTFDLTDLPVTMIQMTFSAYLMVEDSSGNLPLPDVVITLSNSLLEYSESTTTDANGNFMFHPPSQYNLKLVAELYDQGYAFLGGLYFAKDISDDTIIFNLKGSNPDLGIPSYEIKADAGEGYKHYTISADYPFLVGYSTGILKITVTDSAGNTLQGVSVRLNSSDSSQKYIEDTDENGVAEFTNVKTGAYNMTIKVGGFEEYETNLNIQKGDNTPITTNLSSRAEQDFFGMNFGHFMMILGVAIGLVLVILSFLMYSGHLKSRLEED